jgi:hypothetical protein
VTEEPDSGAGQPESAKYQAKDDPVMASARKIRELSTLLSQAWSGRF